MKRLLLILVFLLYATQAHATLISLPTLSEDTSINVIDSNFSIIEDDYNGNVSTDNILNDTLTEPDFADDINPRVRTDELFNDITITGHLPATSTDLTSDISAGTSYVEGFRIVTSATSKTYTASRDIWTFIDINGNFQFETVVNDAAQPATPSNSLLLAKVITDTDNITTVTDLRTTSLEISSPEDFEIRGYYVLSSDNEAVSIDSGVVYAGTTRVEKTSVTPLRTVTTTDWWDSTKDADANGWLYIGVKNTGDIKWIGYIAPDYHDTSGNQQGNLYYWKDTSSNYWRVIGVVRMTAAGDISHMIQRGNTLVHGVPVTLTTTESAAVWKGLSCSSV